MTPDTPLTEVARYLPTEVAQLLTKEEPAVRALVCTLVRDAICMWEANGTVLNPFDYEVVVGSLCAQSIALGRRFARQHEEIAQLRSRIDRLETRLDGTT